MPDGLSVYLSFFHELQSEGLIRHRLWSFIAAELNGNQPFFGIVVVDKLFKG